MRVLALIPARGGSKRLPGKNIRILGGRPLIVWSIDIARSIPEVCDVLVSTDDPAIAKVSKSVGAYVPWLRPSELATDTASSVDVALHALDWYETNKGVVDAVLLLQPTSPFRSPVTLIKAIQIFMKYRGIHPVVSVSPTQNHPAWCLHTFGESMLPFLGWDAIGRRSQELEPAWMLNGSIYLIAPEQLRIDRSFLVPDFRPLIMDDINESIDIDTLDDFELCEKILRKSHDTS